MYSFKTYETPRGRDTGEDTELLKLLQWRRALLVSVSRMAFFILPLMLILPNHYGLTGIWASFPIGESLSATFSTIVSWPRLRRLTTTGIEG